MCGTNVNATVTLTTTASKEFSKKEIIALLKYIGQTSCYEREESGAVSHVESGLISVLYSKLADLVDYHP